MSFLLDRSARSDGRCCPSRQPRAGGWSARLECHGPRFIAHHSYIEGWKGGLQISRGCGARLECDGPASSPAPPLLLPGGPGFARWRGTMVEYMFIGAQFLFFLLWFLLSFLSILYTYVPAADTSSNLVFTTDLSHLANGRGHSTGSDVTQLYYQFRCMTGLQQSCKTRKGGLRWLRNEETWRAWQCRCTSVPAQGNPLRPGQPSDSMAPGGCAWQADFEDSFGQIP